MLHTAAMPEHCILCLTGGPESTSKERRNFGIQTVFTEFRTYNDESIHEYFNGTILYIQWYT